MPRTTNAAIENNFIKGLITETTALKFPPNACTETYDCVFDPAGRVTRRPGIDLETDYVLNNVTLETLEIITEYLWTAVAGAGTTNFAVVQRGSILYFYDSSDNLDLSANIKSFTVNLDNHLPTNATRDPAVFPCSYAQGDGKLIVTNEACDPIFVEYDASSDTITDTSIILKFRDFAGLDDGLGIFERPTASEATLKSGNPEHYYNLKNQGWFTDALGQWDAARTDMPSNADYPALFRSSATDSFDNTIVNASNDVLNTPAAKGHFILDVGISDRNAALIADGVTGVTLTSSFVQISGSEGSTIGSMTNLSKAFDGVTSAAANSGECASENSVPFSWIGKSLSSESFRISQAIVFGSNDFGFDTNTNAAMTITLYAKTGSAPTSSTDGTSLGTVSFTDTGNESSGRTITSSDVITLWDHVWVRIVRDSGSNTRARVAELRFYTSSTENTANRPTSVAFFAGRSWYGGIRTSNLGSNIYFSQIIEDEDQFGKCYQLNDPTSESLATLLPTDGGVIKIPELGNLIRLFTTQNSLLVFATNGVWLIGGTAGASFNATDYTISKLSSVGTNSQHSFVNINGIPFWWAESDIYTVKFDVNYNSYQVIPITTNTIQSFITDIPSTNRRYVKGAYNIDESCAYWLYNDASSLAEADYYKYTDILVLNTVAGSFYPWTIGDSDPDVRGILTASTASTTEAPIVKYTTTIPINATNEYVTFSEILNNTYKDWTDYATFSAQASDEIDYTSYFITGYRLDGQAQRFFQSNYVFVYLDTVSNSSCYMQGIWDFTNSNASGKWSTLQQIYSSGTTLRDVNFRRLKIRGKGRSLQLRFESESGKPFSIMGWSLWETANSAI